jgi:hypothetical protein
MFQGAYTDEFYRALHDALHAQVEVWQSGNNDGVPANRDPDSQYGGSRIDEMWARVTHLEKTCRNPHPTILEESPSLVQLQPAATMAHIDYGAGTD